MAMTIAIAMIMVNAMTMTNDIDNYNINGNIAFAMIIWQRQHGERQHANMGSF